MRPTTPRTTITARKAAALVALFAVFVLASPGGLSAQAPSADFDYVELAASDIAALAELSGEVRTCRGDCQDCGPWGQYWEVVLLPIGSNGGLRDEAAYNCADADCGGISGCIPEDDAQAEDLPLTPDEIDQVFMAAAGAAVGELKTWIGTRTKVTLNTGRSAIQILGCDGRTVVAYVPLPTSMFGALLD